MLSLAKQMEFKVLAVKVRGNDAFAEGSKDLHSIRCKELLMKACALYGEAIEAVMEYETQEVETSDDDTSALLLLRPVLFLNLAASNLKLGAADGALQCCNSAVQLCNQPGLLYSDLKSAEEDVMVIHPMAPLMQSTLTKALFRRAQCFEALSREKRALEDYKSARQIIPNDKAVEKAIFTIEQKLGILEKEKKLAHNCSLDSPDSKKSDSLTDESMTVNGGACWIRRAFWSQTVTDATVYIPLRTLTEFLLIDDDLKSGSDGLNHFSSIWDVQFKCRSITMSKNRNASNNVNTAASNSEIILDLKYNIISSECTWTMDLQNSTCEKNQNISTKIGTSSNPSSNEISRNESEEDFSWTLSQQSMIVLHISKAPSFEWLPGQEWWDRVCDEDEPIDTTCCSVGADTSQLPLQARIRAEKENRRFLGLSDSERAIEIAALVKAKKDMNESHARTHQAAVQEDSAIRDVPERAAMLEAMRKEFPHIDITAK